MNLRERIARRFRYLADRIDPHGAPRHISGWTFTMESPGGMKWREDGKGCEVWYYGEDEYDKAHDEADSPPKYRFKTRKDGVYLGTRVDDDVATATTPT